MKLFASQNYLKITKGERVGATSKAVSVYHKHTMIYTLNMMSSEYLNSKTILHITQCLVITIQIDVTHCITHR